MKRNDANTIANVVSTVTTQNNNIQTAVDALKSITHHQFEMTTKHPITGQVSGFTREDYAKVSEFVEWLNNRKISIREAVDQFLQSQIDNQ